MSNLKSIFMSVCVSGRHLSGMCGAGRDCIYLPWQVQVSCHTLTVNIKGIDTVIKSTHVTSSRWSSDGVGRLTQALRERHKSVAGFLQDLDGVGQDDLTLNVGRNVGLTL
jgi:hypothetical protein